MKIAVIHFGRRGAGPAFSLQMAIALKKLGHTIFYYASSEVENRMYVEQEGFQTRFFTTYNSTISYVKSVIIKYNINSVIKNIKIDSPDVVYSPMNDLWAPFIFPRLKSFLRVKTIHDVGVHEGNDSLFNKWWNKSNFKHADKFVILSKKYIPVLVERGIKHENIAVIPHAGFDYYLKLGQHKECINNRKRLLFFGRIDRYKGLDLLLKAMQKVIALYPDAILYIVGNGDLTPYKELIMNLKDNVEVHNRWIKDVEVSNFVDNSDIVVLPYTHATQSGVIPLAYAFSKPVIATCVGCLDEQVVDGLTGKLVKNVDSDCLADAIVEMLGDMKHVLKMGQDAHNYMVDNLTWNSSARRLIEFISNKSNL